MKGYTAKSKFNIFDRVKFKDGTTGKINGIWDYTHPSMNQGFDYSILIDNTEFIYKESDLNNQVIGVYHYGIN